MHANDHVTNPFTPAAEPTPLDPCCDEDGCCGDDSGPCC
jgi:hypothetical protein